MSPHPATPRLVGFRPGTRFTAGMRTWSVLLGILAAGCRSSGAPSGGPRATEAERPGAVPGRPASGARPVPQRPTFLGFHLGQPEAECRARIAARFAVVMPDGRPEVRARVAGLDLSLDLTYQAGVLTRLQARWERVAAGTPRSSPFHAEIAREWGRDGVCN